MDGLIDCGQEQEPTQWKIGARKWGRFEKVQEWLRTSCLLCWMVGSDSDRLLMLHKNVQQADAFSVPVMPPPS